MIKIQDISPSLLRQAQDRLFPSFAKATEDRPSPRGERGLFLQQACPESLGLARDKLRRRAQNKLLVITSSPLRGEDRGEGLFVLTFDIWI